MLHVGVHDEPLARELVQVPTAPLVGAVDASHEGTGVQVALVSTRFKHDEAPETAYPESHVGVQLDPLASVSVQVPAAPLTGGTAASHALSMRTHEAGGPSFSASESGRSSNSLHTL